MVGTSIFFGALLLFAVVGVVVVVKRGFEVRRLAEDGITTQGTIEKKWQHRGSGGRSTKRLRYAFTDHQGQRRSRAIIASETEHETLGVGQKVDVVYLRDNPRVNALASMVELVRGAMKQRKA